MNVRGYRRIRRLATMTLLALASSGLTLQGGGVAAMRIIYPANNGKLGGTLADGGLYGVFDGVADAWDWTFNGYGGYEGVLTLMQGDTARPLEQRVIWEYDLSSLPADTALSAVLNFTLRGAPIYPFPDMTVHVYSYPSDLAETAADYNAGPATLAAVVVVPPYVESSFRVNITNTVVEAIRHAGGHLALRFQLAPDSPYDGNQAFMDCVDTDDSTKPLLTVPTTAYGDENSDGAIDLSDFPLFPVCMLGPQVAVDAACTVYDFDVDGDVDTVDAAWYGNMQTLFSPD